jgi:parallel beta-helix repeat protein
MIKFRSIFFLFLLCMVTNIAFAGTARYVDLTDTGSSNLGTFAEPFNSIATINTLGLTWNEGDKLYFKASTTHQMDAHLIVYWQGTEEDRAVIGAYSAEGVFTIGGGTRPVLDGQGIYPNSDDKGLIESWGRTGYITVQDLHIKDTYGGGIRIAYPWASGNPYTTNNEVKNCYLENIGRSAIMWARNSYGLIDGNTIDGSNVRCVINYAGNCVNDGAAIEITGMGSEIVTQHNVVRGNTITGSYETIGLYKGARFTTVEDNILYDFGRVGIYIANSRNHVIRRNLIYETSDAFGGRDSLIWADVETHYITDQNWTGNLEIYDNYLAGGGTGILIQCNGNDTGTFQVNNEIYNNRIVDCDRNIRIYQAVTGWENNEIYNNYSYIFTSGLVHVYGDLSPIGVTWSGSHYNTDIVSVSGNAADTAVFDDPDLVNDSGWRDSLVPGSVTRDDFLFVGEGADTCTSLGYYCCTTGQGTGPQTAYDATCDAGQSCYTDCTPSAQTALDPSNAYGGLTHTPLWITLFDDGSGTTLTAYAGSDGTLTNPSWVANGLDMSAVGAVAAFPVPAVPAQSSVVIGFYSTATTAQDYAKLLYYSYSSVHDWQIERYEADTDIHVDAGGTATSFSPVKDVFDTYRHVIVVTRDDTNDAMKGPPAVDADGTSPGRMAAQKGAQPDI